MPKVGPWSKRWIETDPAKCRRPTYLEQRHPLPARLLKIVPHLGLHSRASLLIGLDEFFLLAAA
jgi:hypothetical protein